jgi:flagellar FliL protein
MAGKSAVRNDVPAEGVEKGGMSLARNALAFAVAALIAAGLGCAQGFLTALPPNGPELIGKTGKTGAKKGARADAPVAELGSIDLPPVVTNLVAPPDIWVRIEGTLLFEGKTLPQGEALAGQISGDILAFMRTQSLSQIQGVAGFQHLRQDLNERVVTRSEGRVRELIIKSLVVQ